MAGGVTSPVGSAGRRGAAIPAGAVRMAPSSIGERLEGGFDVFLDAGQLGGLGILRSISRLGLSG